VVSKCANPRCTARLKYLHDGSVFAVRKRSARHECVTDEGSFADSPGTEVEWFWLCEHCSRLLSISRDGSLVCATPSHTPPAMFGVSLF
jgi:hypothetical protein